jgi:hypothetical protein
MLCLAVLLAWRCTTTLVLACATQFAFMLHQPTAPDPEVVIGAMIAEPVPGWMNSCVGCTSDQKQNLIRSCMLLPSGTSTAVAMRCLIQFASLQLKAHQYAANLVYPPLKLL